MHLGIHAEIEKEQTGKVFTVTFQPSLEVAKCLVELNVP
jgi:hypothetical protein